jgi:hypothetical protein
MRDPHVPNKIVHLLFILSPRSGGAATWPSPRTSLLAPPLHLSPTTTPRPASSATPLPTTSVAPPRLKLLPLPTYNVAPRHTEAPPLANVGTAISSSFISIASSPAGNDQDTCHPPAQPCLYSHRQRQPTRVFLFVDMGS